MTDIEITHKYAFIEDSGIETITETATLSPESAAELIETLTFKRAAPPVAARWNIVKNHADSITSESDE